MCFRNVWIENIYLEAKKRSVFHRGEGRGDKIFSAENEEFGQIIQSEGEGGDGQSSVMTHFTLQKYLETKKIKILFIAHLVIT